MERPIQGDSKVFSIEWAFSVSHDKHNTGLLSSISLSLSLLNHQLSSSLSSLSQHQHKTPNPLTENHSLPYLILIPSKPQTHSSTYKPEGPRRRVDFGVDRRWSLSLLSLSRGLCGGAVVWVSGEADFFVTVLDSWLHVLWFGFKFVVFSSSFKESFDCWFHSSIFVVCLLRNRRERERERRCS